MKSLQNKWYSIYVNYNFFTTDLKIERLSQKQSTRLDINFLTSLSIEASSSKFELSESRKYLSKGSPHLQKIGELVTKYFLVPGYQTTTSVKPWSIQYGKIQSLVSLWFILVAHLTNVSVELLLSGGVWHLLTFHILISSWNRWTNMN